MSVIGTDHRKVAWSGGPARPGAEAPGYLQAFGRHSADGRLLAKVEFVVSRACRQNQIFSHNLDPGFRRGTMTKRYRSTSDFLNPQWLARIGSDRI